MHIVAKSPPVCSMSSQHQPEFHQDNLFSFINEFDRSSEPGLEAHHHDQIGPKVSSGFDPTPPTSTLDGIDQSTAGLHPVYETAGMLSEMFSRFEPEPGPSGPGEMVDYRWDVGGLAPEWYGTRQVEPMQLFLTNPPPRSPPSPPQQPPPGNSSSTLHMLLPSPYSIPTGGAGGGFHAINTLHHQQQRLPGNTNPNLWGPDITHPTELGRIVQGQGLSLSLSSSLQPSLQALMGPFGPGTSPSSTGQYQAQQFGFRSDDLSSSSLGMVNVLSNSKYSKPAQELLEEFCSVGIRGHLKNNPKLSRQNSVNPTRTTSSGGGGDVSPSTTKDPPPLSASDRIEHQRRKVKLVSMLDEVYKRYKNYYEEMQMIVKSLELMMGYGSATAYTSLALKAMSRHFRCLKDTIHVQIKQSCKLLREEDPTVTSGLTKGETPRLMLLERSLRQQKTFHQMGFIQQQGWRPQRGLPLSCVNVLRAWLFEHFLNPYPNDTDKHMLARRTGLSKNQVSNWFINARVRLWKPMVEEMYQQESKELEEEGETDFNQTSSSTSNTNNPNPNPNPNPTQNPNTNTFVAETMTSPDSDPSSSLPTTINRGHHHHQQQQPLPPPHGSSDAAVTLDTVNVGPTTMIRFGAASGDVSLTLGLRHAGNAPDKSAAFSVRDFGSC